MLKVYNILNKIPLLLILSYIINFILFYIPIIILTILLYKIIINSTHNKQVLLKLNNPKIIYCDTYGNNYLNFKMY